MTITNMSDSRAFTDYTRPTERAHTYMQKYNVTNSMDLRNSMQNNPSVITKTPLCNKSGAEGQSVLCGGPMSQYVSKKNNIQEYPKTPITGQYAATEW